MAMRPCCDVFGTAKDVERFEIHVRQCTEGGISKGFEPVKIAEADLSPRARKRLGRMIEKGITPPSGPKEESKNAKADTTDAPATA